MSAEVETCTLCGQPKSASSSGSVTQWIAVCQCNLVRPGEETISICASCGKRIAASNTGSFTQWVFRSQICDCKNPIRVDTSRNPNRIESDEKSKPTVGETVSPAPQQSQFATIVALGLTAENFPLNRYKPIQKLGGGAGGSVYLCWDEHLSKRVSVKVLLHRSDANLVAFQKEAKVTAKFQHQNVVSILDFGVTDGGAPFMVLEYVEGIPLDAIVQEEGHVPENLALDLFVQVADALHHGHENGIFHRDIKCSNILIASNPDNETSVKIIDFGVAALLSDSGNQESTAFQGRTIVGTPKYMSPDQALGKTYDARSEIYSFGCVMYETLVGRVPFDDETAVDLLNRHAYELAPSFSEVREDFTISPELEAVVFKCLEKDPDDRFQNMAVLKNALSTIREFEGTAPEATQAANLAFDWRLIAASCVVLLAVLIPLVLLWMSNPENSFDKDTQSKIKKNKEQEEKDYQVKVRVPLLDSEGPFQKREVKFDYLDIPGGYFQAKARQYVVDDDLKELKGRKDVTALNIHRTDVLGPGLKYVVDLPIQSLDINGTTLTDEGFEYISKLKQLNNLQMEETEISDQALSKIVPLPIGILNLNRTQSTVSTLRLLSGMKTLKVLHLLYTKSIDAAALKALDDIPNLKKVSISADDKDEVYFETLGSLKLPIVALVGQKMISAKNLAHLKNARGLCFRGIKLGKPQFAVLRSMKNLKEVEFANAGINDETISEVISLPLRLVALYEEPLTNVGLQELAKMKTLQRIDLQSNKNLTAIGFSKLQKTRPKLIIDTHPLIGLGEYAN